MIQSRKKTTGVTLDPDVIAYLAELAQQTDRSRSWLINSIIREHARQMREKQGVSPVEFRPTVPTIQL